MAKFLVALFCIASLAASSPTVVHYDNYKVFHISFTTEEQFNLLYQLHDNPPTGVMFWQLSHAQHYADIMLAPEVLDSFLEALDNYGFTYKVIIDDVQRTVDAGH